MSNLLLLKNLWEKTSTIFKGPALLKALLLGRGTCASNSMLAQLFAPFLQTFKQKRDCSQSNSNSDLQVTSTVFVSHNNIDC